MATNTPVQQQEEQIILVRGSEEYKEYMHHQGGWLKMLVAQFEGNLATAGRVLLLLFLVYTTVKTGLDRMGVATPIWLEIVMLSLQVGGVEGAVPGLSRQKEELIAQGKTAEAGEIGGAITSTRWLALLTGAEIGLGEVAAKYTVDWLTWIALGYSILLLLARLWLITKFLIAMARIEHKGPKIISQAEYDRMQTEKEREQIRMDNAAVQAVIDQAHTVFQAEQDRKISETMEEIKASLVLPEIAPAQVDMQALIQAVANALVPHFQAEFQARFQAVDEELFRQKTLVSEAHFQAKMLPELRQQIEMIQAKKLPENASSTQANFRQKNQAESPNTQAIKRAHQAEKNVIRLVPANASREELITEAKRLRDVEGLSSYAIAEKLGKPSKTVQSWLSKSRIQAESEEDQAVNE